MKNYSTCVTIDFVFSATGTTVPFLECFILFSNFFFTDKVCFTFLLFAVIIALGK